MGDILKTLKETVKLLENTTRIAELTNGYSPDRKCVFHVDHKKLLVRIGDMDGYEKKKKEFRILKKMQQLHVKAPKPIDIGILPNSGTCYSIYSYIEGKDATEVICKLTEEEQFKLGMKAGTQLSRMHRYKAPSIVDFWYNRAMNKHYKYIDEYKTCGIKINNDHKIIDFIENNKHQLKNRPNFFQHDDFHLANIIVNNKQYSGAIDFNNYDWGDPLHDFVKVALFQREKSIFFSIGQIEGYFDGNVPDDFWKFYSIYVAMAIFSSVIWSLRFAPGQLDEMINRLNVVMEDHKVFELLKPRWYQPEMLSWISTRHPHRRFDDL
ncbi:aminoglycoside phosphotransferase family protein [Sediminibacillus albus]|uniref:Predicted kinase, aminoglycoside phosphotransferase (APT) family n=1 Tax=Sediminibacillus albus TaxID=407036 RepID=A0A1G8YNT8_9BACI|nr:aminoglycoside phosphotransferase family protein [Sediminibacillus albus]SDK04509.1 Predicted kinase, aminoglycoside phosphotransferase (APT) family [Sediminibacillus albus]